MDNLENRVGERRLLRFSDGKMNWPQRGVYFFFEPGEFEKRGKDTGDISIGRRFESHRARFFLIQTKSNSHMLKKGKGARACSRC